MMKQGLPLLRFTVRTLATKIAVNSFASVRSSFSSSVGASLVSDKSSSQ